MNKFKSLFAVLILLVSCAYGTQVRGTLLNADGKPMLGATIEYDLGGCTDANGVPTLVAGGILSTKHFVMKPGAGGQIVDQIVGNDQILCGGGLNTWWVVTSKINNVQSWQKSARIVGGSWRVDTGPYLSVVPTSIPPDAVLKNSVYDQIITVLPGTKLEIDGALVAALTGNADTATGFDHNPPKCDGTTKFAIGSNKDASAACAVIPNSALANSTIGILAGTGLLGGGTPALGGSVTLSLPQTIAVTSSPTFVAVTAPNFFGNSTTATALAVAPAVCAGNNWLKSFLANGTTTCTQIGFANISGSLLASQTPALTGDVTTVAGTVAATLANSGVTAGTFTKLTVDSKGRATLGETAASTDLSDSAGLARLASPTFTGTATAPIFASTTYLQSGNGLLMLGTDAGISRTAAGVSTAGNGTLGNAAGYFNAAGYQVGGVALASGNLSNDATLVKTTAPMVISAAHTFSGILAFSNSNNFNALQNFNAGVLTTAGLATSVPQIVRGFTSQSADLVQWQNSSSSVLARVTKDGYISAPQFQISGGALASTHLSDTANLVRNNANQSIAGTLTATGFIGTLTGNATGNLTGNVTGTTVTASGTVQGATVNATTGFQVAGTPLTWTHLNGKMAMTLLADCTTNGQIPKWTSGVWTCAADISNATGATVFTGLTDAPNSYVGNALRGLRVNAGATGLEFFDTSAGASLSANQSWSGINTFQSATTMNGTLSVLNGGMSVPGPGGAVATGDRVINWNTSSFKASLGGDSTGGTWFQASGPNGNFQWWTGTAAVPVKVATLDVSGNLNLVTGSYQDGGVDIKDLTQVLTNKTYDTEATGNVLKTRSKLYIQAAGCEGAIPYVLMDVPAALAPIPTCVTGANQQKGVLRFGLTGQWAEVTLPITSDQGGLYDARIFTIPNSTAAATWVISYACTSTNSTDDPTWTAWPTLTITAATANTLTIGTATNTTGCSAGQLMHLSVKRTDTTGPAQSDLLGMELTIRRSL